MADVPAKPFPTLDADTKRRLAAIDPWAGKLVRVLDELIPIPGTNQKVGVDAIVGFFLPGAGDLITGAGSISMLFLALKHRIPTVVLGRMIVNIFVDMLAGTIPVAGDLFDVFFRSNRRNLDLIEAYKGDPSKKPSTVDYVLVAVGLGLVALSVVLPFLIWGTIGTAAYLAVRELLGLGAPTP